MIRVLLCCKRVHTQVLDVLQGFHACVWPVRFDVCPGFRCPCTPALHAAAAAQVRTRHRHLRSRIFEGQTAPSIPRPRLAAFGRISCRPATHLCSARRARRPDVGPQRERHTSSGLEAVLPAQYEEGTTLGSSSAGSCGRLRFCTWSGTLGMLNGRAQAWLTRPRLEKHDG